MKRFKYTIFYPDNQKLEEPHELIFVEIAVEASSELLEFFRKRDYQEVRNRMI